MENLNPPSKVVLVTGASGFVGSHLVKALVDKGYCIKAVMRNAVENGSDAVRVVSADLSMSIDWGHHLDDVSTVIHLAARVHQMKESPLDSLDEFKNINTRATLELAEQAAQLGVKKFIYLSTMAVNGSFTLPGKLFTEDSPPCPKSSYAISKYEAELGLQKIARQYPMEVVIIRPPMVYGPNAPGNFSKLVSLVKTRIPLPFALAKNPRSFIYIGNLVDFTEVCIKHSGAGCQLFLVSDGDDISLSSLIGQVSHNLKLRISLFPVPLGFLERMLVLLGRTSLANQLLKPMRIDVSKAREFMGWIPPYKTSDGIELSVKRGDHQ